MAMRITSARRPTTPRLCLEALETRCVPAFYVDTSADTHDKMVGDGFAIDGNGKTSLRAAIEEGNAGNGAHIIITAIHPPGGGAPLLRTIALESALPTLNKNFVIEQDFFPRDLVPRPTITRAPGAAAFRIFTVGENSESVLRYLALTGGDAGGEPGGGVFNYGKVSLSECWVYGNVAASGGGVSSDGRVGHR